MEDPSVDHQIATITGWLAEHYADEAMTGEVQEQLQALAIVASRCGCATCLACWDMGEMLVAWIGGSEATKVRKVSWLFRRYCYINQLHMTGCCNACEK